MNEYIRVLEDLNSQLKVIFEEDYDELEWETIEKLEAQQELIKYLIIKFKEIEEDEKT